MPNYDTNRILFGADIAGTLLVPRVPRADVYATGALVGSVEMILWLIRRG